MGSRFYLVSLLSIIISVFAPAQVRRSQSEIEELKPGDQLSRELSGGASHYYSLQLPARRFIHVMVQQQGIDVEVALSLNGTELSKVDRPNGSRGREAISLITGDAGSYVLTIKALEGVAAKGDYELCLLQVRDPRESDQLWIKAEQTVSEAERVRFAQTAASFRNAIQLFNSAAEMWHQLDQPYEEAVALYGSGISSFSLGNNQEALEYLNRSLRLFGNDPYGRTIAMAAMGWPNMYLGNYEQAKANFVYSFDSFHADRNVRGEGIALYGLAWIHALQGETSLAHEKFRLSLERRRSAEDRRGEAITLAGIGKIEARRGRYVEAIRALNESLQLLRDDYAKADSLSNLGWIYSSLGHHQFASEYFHRALPLRQRVGDLVGEATTLYGLGVTERNLGHFNEALEMIDNAVEIIEKLRVGGTNQQLRISYFASVEEYYHFYISLLMQLHRSEPNAGYDAKALHVYERARARGLIDLLSEGQIDFREGVDKFLLEEERRLDDEINAAGAKRYQLLSQTDAFEEARKMAQKVQELSVEYDAVQARIRSSNPKYADLLRPKPLTASQIQSLIDDDTLLLEYALGDEKSYVWTVTRNAVAGFELPSRSKIESVVRPAYECLVARNRATEGKKNQIGHSPLANEDSATQKGLEELSKILLEPIANRLRTKRVVIIASGVLQFVPFAALPDPRSQRRLIFDHELLVLPSATTLLALRNQRQARKEPSKLLAIVADPIYSASDARFPDEQRKGLRSEAGFPRLVSSLWEARRIVSHAASDQSKVLMNFEANRKAVVNASLSEYRFLHFAAHAIIDGEQPQLSGLVLSTIDQRGNPQDGFLRSNAIFKLNLAADLVVLSACRTGLGKDLKGEGMINLTRAFMYAGSQRVLVSLWDVEDTATSQLMVRFYDALLGSEKLSPAAALQKAQIEMSQDPRWRSPYYWAPFVLQGEW